MQNKKIKDLLLTNIINSDFLLLDKKTTARIHNIKFISNYNQIELASLDLFKTLKSVKQLIRSLRFISNSPQKFLQVVVENKQYIRILNLFLKKPTNNLNFLVKSSFISTPCYKSVNQLLLLLTHPLKNNTKLLKKIVQSNIFLINKINTKSEQNDWGSYKIYNDLNNFKKFIFVVILLDIILNNKNYN